MNTQIQEAQAFFARRDARVAAYTLYENTGDYSLYSLQMTTADKTYTGQMSAIFNAEYQRIAKA